MYAFMWPDMGNSLDLVRRFETKGETIRNGVGPNADLFGLHSGVIIGQAMVSSLEGNCGG